MINVTQFGIHSATYHSSGIVLDVWDVNVRYEVFTPPHKRHKETAQAKLLMYSPDFKDGVPNVKSIKAVSKKLSSNDKGVLILNKLARWTDYHVYCSLDYHRDILWTACLAEHYEDVFSVVHVNNRLCKSMFEGNLLTLVRNG